jgi:hypothetical protein
MPLLGWAKPAGIAATLYAQIAVGAGWRIGVDH